jgi:DNA-directed RNA polymerase specialized sigma24 family protein
MRKSPPGTLVGYLRCALAAWKDDPRDDAELLALFADRHDEGAFTTLVGRHGQLVWGTCLRRLHDVHAAEDAFQATFLELARKAGRLRATGLAGWLHTVARGKASDACRKDRRRQSRERRVAAATPAAPD